MIGFLSLSATLSLVLAALPGWVASLPRLGTVGMLEIDCDRDGIQESLAFVGGQLRLGGGPAQPIPHNVEPTVAPPMASGPLQVCRIDVRPPGKQGEALLWKKVDKAWQFWMRLPAGPSADGERTLELGLENGALYRWERTAETTRCDGEGRLFLARWDEAAQKFVPTPLPTPSGPPLPLQPAVRRGARSAYRVVAVSAQEGVTESADRLAPPAELGDEDRQTVWRWQTPRGVAWLNARRTSGKAPLLAIEIDLPPGERPERVALIVDKRPPQVATIPPRDETIRIALLPQSSPACVSLVFEGTDDRPLQIAGVRLYDGGAEGVAGQLDEYLRGELHVTNAARLAAQATFEVALREKLRTTTDPALRRKLIELALRATPKLPIALRCALWKEQTEAERSLYALLVDKDAAAQSCLTETLRDRTQPETTRSEAARLLGWHGKAEVVTTLRSAFTGSMEARGLDGAIAAALRELLGRQGELQAALLDQIDDRQRPLVYYVAAKLPTLGPALRDRLVADLAASLDFDSELLLLDALAVHPIPAAAAGLRARLSYPRTDPVIVWRATRALGVQTDAESLALLQRSLRSTLPRVRLAALQSLVAQRQAPADAVVNILDDRWPELQQRAATALGSLCTPGSSVRDAIATRLSSRRAPVAVALELVSSYAQCPGDPLPLFDALLDDARQPPELRARVVVELTRRATPATPDRLAKTLSAILDDPTADERQVELLLALTQALGRLGKTSLPVERALGTALREPSLPMLRAAAYEAVAAICPPDGPAALEKGLSDPQPEVAAAVRRAKASCPRGR